MINWYNTIGIIKHYLTAWNTGGENIHSPSLFYFVRMILYDKNQYYAWQDIERSRKNLLSNSNYVQLEDFGVGKYTRRRISTIAQTSLASPKKAQILFRTIEYICQQQSLVGNRLNVVELGTSLGITTAYLASQSQNNRVLTFEGSEELIRIAKNVWNKIGINNIVPISGDIDLTLESSLNKELGDEQIDFVFIDANHTYEATMRYWKLLVNRAKETSIFVMDDIRYSKQMNQAWRDICQSEKVTSALDFGDFGMLIFNPYLKKNVYKLRV